MARVLLVSSLTMRGERMEPVALEMLAAVLQERGHDVHIVCCFSDETGERDVLDLVVAWGPTVVGFTMWVVNAAFVISTSTALKERAPDVFTVVGGYHAPLASTRQEGQGIDCFITGEGELAIAQVVDAVVAGHRPERIVRGTVVPDLDSLPLPARGLVPMDCFPVLEDLADPGEPPPRTSFVFTYRGCPFACSFCAVGQVFERSIRKRSIAHVIGELQDLAERHGVHAFINEEDLLFADKARVLELCEAIRGSGYSFRWTCSATVRRTDSEILQALMGSGCRYVFVGAVSGSDDILRSAGVGFGTDHLRKALTTARAVGMPVSAAFMVGFPGETRNTLEATARFIEETRDLYWDVGIGIVRPWSGTPLARGRRSLDELVRGPSLSPALDIDALTRFVEQLAPGLDFTF